MRKKERSKIGGFYTNRLVIPLVVIVAILHIFIVVLVFEEHRSNTELSELMQRCSDFQQYATNLQAGSSVLSETASSFAQVPVNDAGETNVGPLLRYVEELNSDRRGPQVSAWFRENGASEENQAYIDQAAESSGEMLSVQLHAIALLKSVYPFPPIPALASLPDTPLTEQEQAMPEEQRVGTARQMLMNQEYALLRYGVAEQIEQFHEAVSKEYAISAAKCEQHIRDLRVALWLVIFGIIMMLSGTFFLFYRWLVRPIRSYSRQITSDQNMTQVSPIREIRVLADAYNDLLRRHGQLESILRSAAETDSLTDLPNRYSLEHYVLENEQDEGSVAVLLFDVNYLKRMNDTQGHQAGDELLRNASACIRECFDIEENGNCYRIGGDEFAAVLRGCSEEEVRRRIEHFNEALERDGISVSVGYGYTEKMEETSFKQLMDKADKYMYAHKKRTHEQDQSRPED